MITVFNVYLIAHAYCDLLHLLRLFISWLPLDGGTILYSRWLVVALWGHFTDDGDDNSTAIIGFQVHGGSITTSRYCHNYVVSVGLYLPT